MKVLMLIPGTGNFHCGSCLRDQTLARALRRRGVRVDMAGLYLPWVTDRQTEGDAPMFFGGINTYLQQKSGVFRRTPRWVDAMWDASGLLRLTAGVAHMTRPKDLAELTISMLQGEDGRQVKELERLVDWMDRDAASRPDVVMLNNVLLIGMARRIRQRTGAKVVCTLHGEDGFLDSLPESHRDEAWAILRERTADVDGFVAVSEYYAKVMGERMGLPAEKMHVVHNGIEMDGFAPAEAPPSDPMIGYMARMCPSKGLGTLVQAYMLLRRDAAMEHVRLRIGGAMTPGDKAYVKDLQLDLAAEGMADGVSFEPNLSREQKIALLQGIHVLSVPATYGESFGLYVIEAWACGVPVVQPNSGAFGELLGVGGGGMLCEPDDAAALAAGLRKLLNEPDEARRLGEQGRAAVVAHFTDDHMAAGVMAVLEKITQTTQV